LLCDFGRLRFEPWSRRFSKIKREVCILLEHITGDSLQNELFGDFFALL
jgi:hypothetical protein